MIHRTHESHGTRSEAVYSDCECYRYGLARQWSEAPPVLFVMLNPSTATELANDPTIHRCEQRARTMRAGGVQIANLFGFRATRPADLKTAPDPVGPDNDELLMRWHGSARMTVAAWGVHGAYRGRAACFAHRMGKLWHLGLTRDGHPRHPLYVPYATVPAPWDAAARYPVAAGQDAS
ncbi:DUF1643 domain-containing protein [Roseivivax sp. CAU 1753]